MWRGAVGERVEQEAEPLARLVLPQADRLEDLALHVGCVDADRAAADLRAVPDEVVGTAAPGARIAVEVPARGGERMVERVPAPLLHVPAEHREIGYPDEVVAVLGHADVETQLAENPRRDGRLVGDGEDRVADLRARGRYETADLVLGEELRDRRAPAVLLDDAPDEPLGAKRLRLLGEPVEALARELARRAEATDRAAGGERPAEDLELRRREHLAEVGDLDRDAPVGPVGAVAQHRLVVAQPLDRRRHLDAADR